MAAILSNDDHISMIREAYQDRAKTIFLAEYINVGDQLVQQIIICNTNYLAFGFCEQVNVAVTILKIKLIE